MIHMLDALFNYYSGFPILIATLFFVVGQVFLKKSFNKDNDFVDTTLYYNAFMGVLSFVLLMIKYRNNTLNTNIQNSIGSFMPLTITHNTDTSTIDVEYYHYI